MVWVQIFKTIIVVLITMIICAYSSNLEQNQVMKKINQIKTNYIKNAMNNLWIIKNISNSFNYPINQQLQKYFRFY